MTISLFGQLDYRHDYATYIANLISLCQQKDCRLDLTYCTYIDNAGMLFIMQLRTLVVKQERTFTVAPCSEEATLL